MTPGRGSFSLPTLRGDRTDARTLRCLGCKGIAECCLLPAQNTACSPNKEPAVNELRMFSRTYKNGVPSLSWTTYTRTWWSMKANGNLFVNYHRLCISPFKWAKFGEYLPYHSSTQAKACRWPINRISLTTYKTRNGLNTSAVTSILER